jgi:hypothetical protein
VVAPIRAICGKFLRDCLLPALLLAPRSLPFARPIFPLDTPVHIIYTCVSYTFGSLTTRRSHSQSVVLGDALHIASARLSESISRHIAMNDRRPSASSAAKTSSLRVELRDLRELGGKKVFANANREQSCPTESKMEAIREQNVAKLFGDSRDFPGVLAARREFCSPRSPEEQYLASRNRLKIHDLRNSTCKTPTAKLKNPRAPAAICSPQCKTMEQNAAEKTCAPW